VARSRLACAEPGLLAPARKLEREAAIVVALGGGFQAYFTQRRDGSVRLEQMPAMAETAAFCRERQALCHRSEPVPQVALFAFHSGALPPDQETVRPRAVRERLRGTSPGSALKIANDRRTPNFEVQR